MTAAASSADALASRRRWQGARALRRVRDRRKTASICTGDGQFDRKRLPMVGAGIPVSR